MVLFVSRLKKRDNIVRRKAAVATQATGEQWAPHLSRGRSAGGFTAQTVTWDVYPVVFTLYKENLVLANDRWHSDAIVTKFWSYILYVRGQIWRISTSKNFFDVVFLLRMWLMND